MVRKGQLFKVGLCGVSAEAFNDGTCCGNKRKTNFNG